MQSFVKRAIFAVAMSAISLAATSDNHLNTLTLEQAAMQSLRYHPQILAARASQTSTHFAVDAARGGYLPHISVNTRGGYEASDNPFLQAQSITSAEFFRDEHAININQMLFDNGKVRGEVGTQRFNLLAARYRLQSSEQNIILRTAEAFFNVLRGRELVVLAQDSIAVHQRTLEQVSIRYKGGAGTSGEVELARGRLALARIRLHEAQGILKQSNAKFYSIVGMLPPPHLIKPRSVAHFLPPSLATAVRSTVAYHPDLNSSQADVLSRHETVRTAKAHMLPRVDLQVSATSNRNVDGVGGRNRDMSAMLSVNYDLFNGGSDLAAINRARSEEIEAKHLFQQKRRSIIEEIATRWANYNTQRNIYYRQREYVQHSKVVVDDYKEQFQLGNRALFNVLDAENELFRARTGLSNAYYDAIIEGYRLLTAMGKITPEVVRQV